MSGTRTEVIRLRIRTNQSDGTPGFEKLFEELAAIQCDAKRRQHVMRILHDYSQGRQYGRSNTSFDAAILNREGLAIDRCTDN